MNDGYIYRAHNNAHLNWLDPHLIKQYRQRYRSLSAGLTGKVFWILIGRFFDGGRWERP
jgi:hypothetical protein